MSKIRVASLFSGIGGFETGIFNALGKDNVDVVFSSEIDKYANQAYEILYGDKTSGDITLVHEKDVPDHDFLVGGFPCQAFSVSGKRLGFEDTRGTLFFEIARIAKEKQPKVMLLENVKGLVSHNKGETLQTIIRTLCEIGYSVDFQILNSKFFSVPQNRERIFIVAVKDGKQEEWTISKKKSGIDEAKKKLQEIEGIKSFNFEFPEQLKVEKCIRDILEADIDEKYYMSKERIKQFVQKEISSNGDIQKIGYIKNNREQNRVHNTEGVMPTITANNQGGRRPGGLIAEEDKKMSQIGYIDKNAQGNRVYSVDGIGPTVSSQTGGAGGSGGGVFAIEDDRLKKMIQEDIQDIVSKSRKNTEISINFKENGDIRPHRNDPRKSGISELNINHEDNVSFTVTASHSPKIYGETTFYRIRKLTPLECFRLQSFPDKYYHKLKENGISDSQLYKMAGNAVTTNVIQSIVNQMKSYL